MTQPSKFLLNSDFPTLKNDDEHTVQFIIPGGLTVAAGSSISGTADIPMGQLASVIRARIASTFNSDIFYSGNSLIFDRLGTVGGFPAAYGLACFVYRISATEVRFQVYIPNPYGSTLTTEAGTDTVTMQANTFITPFV